MPGDNPHGARCDSKVRCHQLDHAPVGKVLFGGLFNRHAEMVGFFLHQRLFFGSGQHPYFYIHRARV